jgi:hypothetical protein
MFEGGRSYHHVRQGKCSAFVRPCVFQGPGSARDRAGNRVTVQAGKKSLSPGLFSAPHAGVDLTYIDGRSSEEVTTGDKFRQQRSPILPRAKHVEQNGGVEQKDHFARLPVCLAFGTRFSPSDRRRFTHAPAPAANSGWSVSLQAG